MGSNKLVTKVHMQMPNAGKCQSDTYEHRLELLLTSLAKWFYKASKTAIEKIGLRKQTAQPSVVLCLQPVLKVSEGVMLLI